DDRIDDRELEVRELLGHFLHAAGLREADPDDDGGAPARHVAQRLLALGLGGHLELAIRDPRFLLEALGAGVGRLVERLVELPAHVEHDRGNELLREGGADQGQHEEGGEGGAEQSRESHVRSFCMFDPRPATAEPDLAGGRRPDDIRSGPSCRHSTEAARSATPRKAASIRARLTRGLFSCGMPTAPKVDMASPLGFSEAGRHFYGSVLVPFVAGLGYEVLDPWALVDRAKIEAVQRLPYGSEKREAWHTLNREIGATNRAAIDRADGLVAVLDGVDVDSGT